VARFVPTRNCARVIAANDSEIRFIISLVSSPTSVLTLSHNQRTNHA
jgi:hypothetical protein